MESTNYINVFLQWLPKLSIYNFNSLKGFIICDNSSSSAKQTRLACRQKLSSGEGLCRPSHQKKFVGGAKLFFDNGILMFSRNFIRCKMEGGDRVYFLLYLRIFCIMIFFRYKLSRIWFNTKYKISPNSYWDCSM